MISTIAMIRDNVFNYCLLPSRGEVTALQVWEPLEMFVNGANRKCVTLHNTKYYMYLNFLL